ncbi:MAG: hypothetical protein ACC661_02010 [Verrucomicrobiales bacterium]
MQFRNYGIFLGVALVCCLAWFLPSAKPEAALGRYSYPEMMMALAAAGILLSSVSLVFAPSSRRKTRLFRILALWMGGLAVLGGAELFASLLPPKGNPFYAFNEGGTAVDNSVDPRLPYTRPPHLKWEGWSQGDIPEWPDPSSPRRRIVFQTDRDGFRNSEETFKADLVFIGDSFTEAGNVLEEESFVFRSAAALNCSARNLGLFGYGPQSELVVLEQYGLACKPRAVVWQLCAGNDLNDAAVYSILMAGREELGRPPTDRGPTHSHSSWQQRSPSYAFFRRLVKHERWWLAGTVRDAGGRPQEMRFGYWPTVNHFPLGHPEAPWRGDHPGWGPMVESLRQGKAMLAERGIKLIILLVPTKLSVFGDLVEFDAWSMAHPIPYLRVPPDQSLEVHLARLCRELELPLIDTSEALRGAARAGQFPYLMNDTHLSPLGHEIVSELIVGRLKDDPVIFRSP